MTSLLLRNVSVQHALAASLAVQVGRQWKEHRCGPPALVEAMEARHTLSLAPAKQAPGKLDHCLPSCARSLATASCLQLAEARVVIVTLGSHAGGRP